MKKVLLSTIISIISVSFCLGLCGGTIRGKITDENGEAAIGATIVLKSKPSIGTVTDMDGNYSLKIPDSTTETIIISLLGYKPVEETVLPFFPVLIRNYTLEPLTKAVKEVQITAKAVKAKEYYMEKVKINSATTLDYISNETMKKTGDVNIVTAVARVPGVSTTSSGFFSVRGIGDRYIKTAINGSRIPTLDPFTNNIKLDLFPASLVDNVMITKTASPDLPGDWAGAYLSVETKDYPDQMTVFAETSVGYNTQSTFKEVTSSQRSSTDWLGYDNGFRDYDHKNFVPMNISPSNYQEFVALGLGSYYNSLGITQQNWSQNYQTYFNLGLVQLGLLGKAQINDQNAVTAATNAYNQGPYHVQAFDILNAAAVKSNQAFADNWNTTTRTAPLDFSQDFSIGNQVKLFGKPLGLLGGFRYSTVTRYDPNAASYKVFSGRVVDGKAADTDTTNQKLSKAVNGWSALLNASYKFSPNHSLSLLFMPNMIGENNARNGLLTGDLREYSGSNSSLRIDQYYESRSQTIYQLKSENYLPGPKLKFQLDASYTHGSSTDPDLKSVTIPIDTSIINSTNASLERYFRYLTDNVFDSRLTFELPLDNSATAGTRKIKFGVAYQRNDRQYDQYDYQIEHPLQIDQFITGHGNSDPFSPEWFAIGPIIDGNGYPTHSVARYYAETGLPTDHSFGYSTIKAGFVMLDYSVTPRLRFAGGLRIEQAYIYTDLKMFDSLGYAADDPRRYVDKVGIVNPGKLDEVNYLPSANIVYKLRADDLAPFNLRVNYSQTVARPSIRELSDYSAYDYVLDDIVIGNPNLKSVQINNYDLRLEYYFKSGDNVSVSGFYKDFKNHIELENFPPFGYTWVKDTKKAWLTGIELEGKKSITRNLVATANVTLVNSHSTFIKSYKLTNGSFVTGDTVTRTMYGQAPFGVNAILDYNIEKLGLGATVSYNIQGSKLVIAGGNGTPDVYERPRNVLDLKLTKILSKHFNVSVKVRDILNATYLKSYKYPEGYILDYERYKMGTNYVLAISYKI